MNIGERLLNLTKNLDKSERVRSFDNKSEKEAGALALAILDIEGSFKEIIAKIPKLENQHASEEEIDETLWDIECQLKHIVYHLYDAKSLRHLTTDIDHEDHPG